MTWEEQTMEGLRLTNELIGNYIPFDPNTQIEHTDISDELRREVTTAFWGQYFSFCLQMAVEDAQLRRLLKRQGGVCTAKDQIDHLHFIAQR